MGGKELLQRKRTVLIPGRTAPKKCNLGFLSKLAGKPSSSSGIDNEESIGHTGHFLCQ